MKVSTFATGALVFFSCIKEDFGFLDETEIPSYYMANGYLNKKIDRIKQLLEEDGVKDAFVFITDQHWEHNAKHSPSILRYIQTKVNIERLFCGGDIADGCSKDSFDYVKELCNSWSGEIHCVVGNHEYLGSEYATEDRVYELFKTNPQIQIGNHRRHYYYVDNNKDKVRYIILSSYSQSVDGGLHANLGYGDEQAKWLKDVALNVSEGWNIILFTNFMFFIGVNDDKISVAEGASKIIDIIDNYEGLGRIIAVFHGHNHRDRVIRLNNSSIPVIVTTCDKNIILGDDQQNIVRLEGTKDEQAFDVVVINELFQQIHCVRIGCSAMDGYNDEVGGVVEERIIDY